MSSINICNVPTTRSIHRSGHCGNPDCNKRHARPKAKSSASPKVSGGLSRGILKTSREPQRVGGYIDWRVDPVALEAAEKRKRQAERQKQIAASKIEEQSREEAAKMEQTTPTARKDRFGKMTQARWKKRADQW